MPLPSISRSRGDHADDEAGEIVLAVGVEAGHLRGLAAEQRAAVLAARAGEPLDDLDRDVRVEPAGRQVVEEEQRLRALDEDVVDAVIDEVDADSAVHAGHERDAQLGAHAVGAGDEHRDPRCRRRRGGTGRRRTDLGQHAGRECPARQRSDPAHDLVARVDVDAGLLVVHQNSSV